MNDNFDEDFAQAFDELKAAKGQEKGFGSSNVEFLPGFHSGFKAVSSSEQSAGSVNFHDPFKGQLEGAHPRTGVYDPGKFEF